MPIEDLFRVTCDEDSVEHVCDPCDDVEGGRIRHAAFIHKSVLATLMTDLEDEEAWVDAVQAGTVKLIPNIRGNSDGGSKNTRDGYGDATEEVTGRTVTVNFKDPNYKKNCEFYTALENSKGRTYHFAYLTETLLHISDKPVSVFAKNPVEDGKDSDVVWDIEVVWKQKKPVCPIEDFYVDIFDCFQITPPSPGV